MDDGNNKLSFEELAKKDEDELKRIKLAQEISTFHERLALDKKKFRTENVRVYALALTTAVISLGVTYIVKLVDANIADKNRIKTEVTDNVKEYNKTTDRNLKRELACGISAIDNPYSDNSVQKSIDKFKHICDTMAVLAKADAIQRNNINDADTLKADVKQATDELNNYDNKINQLKNQLATTDQADAQTREKLKVEIKQTNEKLQQVIATAPPEVKLAVQSSDKIEQIVKSEIELLSSDEGQSVKRFPVVWFKEGYYLMFDRVKISLNQLSKRSKTITVTICEVDSSGNCQTVYFRDRDIELYDFAQVKTSNGTYKITLASIDRAGNNPFTPAAYLVVELTRN